MPDPAIDIFKRFVGRTHEFHTKLKGELEFKFKDDRRGSDVKHFAPTNGELERDFMDAVEKYTDKHGYGEDDAEGNTIILPKKEVLIAFKKELVESMAGGYPAEDIIEEWMPQEECCAYCYYGYECDVPSYINFIYKQLNLSADTCERVTRDDDYVVGVIVNSVARHILKFFLEKIDEELADEELAEKDE